MVWGLYRCRTNIRKMPRCHRRREYLGPKNGGWVPRPRDTESHGNKWICVPVATTGSLIDYRIRHMEAAGFKEFPKDTAGFLEL